jgi:hypothetical protein
VPVKITCNPLTGSSIELRKQNGPRSGTEFTPLCNLRPGSISNQQLEVRGAIGAELARPSRLALQRPMDQHVESSDAGLVVLSLSRAACVMR